MPVSILFLLMAQSAPTSQPLAAPEALRFSLKVGGDVYVPPRTPPDAERLDLFVHFHGGAEVIERELDQTSRPGVLITVNFKGLSSAYEKPFAAPQRFQKMLRETLAELKSRGRAPRRAKWGRVCVSSFSAGFGAVRALLQAQSNVDRIDALVLADTVYAGYAEIDGKRVVNPEHVLPFRRYAERAVAGDKLLVLSHCYLKPNGYAGTHEAADALVASLKLQRRTVSETGPGGLRIISRVDEGRFHVYGCAGDTGEDHGAHLSNLSYWLGKLDWP